MEIHWQRNDRVGEALVTVSDISLDRYLERVLADPENINVRIVRPDVSVKRVR